MKKTFVTNISLQSKKIWKLLYQPVGFEMKKNRVASFPIIPVIAEHLEERDELKVLAICSEALYKSDNYAAFFRELSELGIRENQVTVIFTGEDQSDSENLKLLLKILDEIPDDSMVYGDITYGTKPKSAILLYAMNFIEKMKDCEVEGIYYGEIRWENGEAKEGFLYDLVIFKLLDDMIDQMKCLGINDIKSALERMIRL